MNLPHIDFTPEHDDVFPVSTKTISEQVNEEYNREITLLGYREIPVNNKMPLDKRYLELAIGFYSASFRSLFFIINNRGRNDIIDRCSISSLYLMRHSIELLLKSKILEQKQNSIKICSDIFQKELHNLSNLFSLISIQRKNTSYIFVKKYIDNMTAFDEKEDLFRYPFGKTFRKSFSFIDFKNMSFIYLYVFEKLLKILFDQQIDMAEDTKKEFRKCCRKAVKEFAPNGEYLIRAKTGIGHMYTWQIHDNDTFLIEDGNKTVCKILYHFIKKGCDELVYPTLFLFRHTVELLLKHIVFEFNYCSKKDLQRIGINIPIEFLKAHEPKDLWKYAIEIYKYFDEQYDGELTVTTQKIDDCIKFIQSVDKNGDKYRYPTNKGLEVTAKIVDFQETYKFYDDLICVVELIDNLIDVDSDYRSDMDSYY